MDSEGLVVSSLDADLATLHEGLGFDFDIKYEVAYQHVRDEIARLRDEALPEDESTVGKIAHAAIEEIERLSDMQSIMLSRMSLLMLAKGYLQFSAQAEAAERELARLWEGLRDAKGVVDGVIWLDNNIHNYGTDAWRSYFKAVLRDARRARGLLAEDDTA